MPALNLDDATPLLRRAYDYWLSKRGSHAMPARVDIDPAEIVPLLPNLVLLDVLHDPRPDWALDFRYRLLGTYIDAMMNARYTGLCLSQLSHQQPGSQFWASLEAVALAKEPRLNHIPYVGPHKDFLSVVDMVMPLSNDGAQVNMLFCIVDFVARQRPSF